MNPAMEALVRPRRNVSVFLVVRIVVVLCLTLITWRALRVAKKPARKSTVRNAQWIDGVRLNHGYVENLTELYNPSDEWGREGPNRGERLAREMKERFAKEKITCVETLPQGSLGWNSSALCVTNTVFMDIQSGDKSLGRLKVGLFGEAVPLSAYNFLSFVRCIYGPRRCLKGDDFHRLVKDFVIQGGSSSTGHSFINNETFREQVSDTHHSVLQHARAGVLAWAEYPIGSQFYIVSCCADRGPVYLDGNHVVFGSLLGEESFTTLKKMTQVRMGTTEKPLDALKIINAGIIA